MKTPKLKNHVVVLLTTLVLATVSCSKDDNVDPDDGGFKPPVEDIFVPQTPGITIQKVDTPAGNIAEYLLYIPETYNTEKSYKWPIVIFLHGKGEMGTNINVLTRTGLPKVVNGKPFVMIAPQCTKTWWNTDALQQLYKQVLEKYHVDSSRVYLTGLSMGGFETWNWAQISPEKFAAIIPISGGGTPSNACVLKNMPVWAFHNDNDPTVNVVESRNMVNALKACGSKVLTYTETVSKQHDAWTKAYADSSLYTWMLAQKR
jgi:predicted peptidase